MEFALLLMLLLPLAFMPEYGIEDDEPEIEDEEFEREQMGSVARVDILSGETSDILATPDVGGWSQQGAEPVEVEAEDEPLDEIFEVENPFDWQIDLEDQLSL